MSEPKQLKIEPEFWGSETPPNLGLVTILGENRPVSEVEINHVSVPFRYDTIHKVGNLYNILISN